LPTIERGRGQRASVARGTGALSEALRPGIGRKQVAGELSFATGGFWPTLLNP